MQTTCWISLAQLWHNICDQKRPTLLAHPTAPPTSDLPLPFYFVCRTSLSALYGGVSIWSQQRLAQRKILKFTLLIEVCPQWLVNPTMNWNVWPIRVLLLTRILNSKSWCPKGLIAALIKESGQWLPIWLQHWTHLLFLHFCIHMD